MPNSTRSKPAHDSGTRKTIATISSFGREDSAIPLPTESEAKLYDFDLTRFLRADRHPSSGRSRGHASRKSGSQTFRNRGPCTYSLVYRSFCRYILRIRTIVEVSRLSERAGRGFKLPPSWRNVPLRLDVGRSAVDRSPRAPGDIHRFEREGCCRPVVACSRTAVVRIADP